MMLRLLLCLLFAVTFVKADDSLVFVNGGPLVGGTNGMYFDAENNLHVAQVFGQRISKLNPETGEILEQLGPADSVLFPDDVTIGPNGTLYWTEIFYGTLYSKDPGKDSVELYPLGSYPFVNPLTLSDDGSRLFFAQCFDVNPQGIYERNLVTGETTTILADIDFCASNAMDYLNKSLYSPRLYEGRVLKIDLDNDNKVTDVATDVGVPVAVKLDSKQRLYFLDASKGQVLRVKNLEGPPENNTELVAQAPFLGLDNLAFDKDDRLYISSYTTGEVLEVLGVDDFRVVAEGIMSIPLGLAVLDDTIYTMSPNGLYGYNVDTAEQSVLVEGLTGFEIIPSIPTSVVAISDDALLQLSYVFNSIALWDTTTQSAGAVAEFPGAIDAHSYQGGLLVVDVMSGNIHNVSLSKLEERELVLTVPGARFLAGNEEDVYLSTSNGTIVQIFSNGQLQNPPQEISSGHNSPEGIALHGNELLVVSAGSASLEKVNLDSGEVTAIANDLDFLPAFPGFDIGWPNDVAVHNGYAYINGDGANVIYKIPLETSSENSSSSGIGGALFLAISLFIVTIWQLG